MKINLKQIWNAQQSLSKLITQDLELKSSYWINKQAKKLQKELEAINEQRVKLVKKYGEKQKDGNYKVKKMEPFMKEFNKFLETEIEIELQTIPFEYLKDAKLSPADFMTLDFLIKEPKNDKKNS